MRVLMTWMMVLIPLAAVAGEPPKSALPAPEVKLETAVDVVPGFPLARIEMVKIPAGMVEIPGKDGAEAKKVAVKSIWIGRTELTWDAYDPFWMRLDLSKEQKEAWHVDSRPSKPYGHLDGGFGHEGFPAIHLHDNAARKYCEWLSAKTGKKYRLPTQAEWIYAAQAGKPAEKLDKEALKKTAWFKDNSVNAETDDREPHAVAKLAPNAWGLFDMLGNVAEWVMTDDESRIVMGGHFEERAVKCQTTACLPCGDFWDLKNFGDPRSQWWLLSAPFVGFRVVREE